MRSVRWGKLALWLVLMVGACGVAEGPIELIGSGGAEPGLRSVTETGVAGAAGAAGAESD